LTTAPGGQRSCYATEYSEHSPSGGSDIGGVPRTLGCTPTYVGFPACFHCVPYWLFGTHVPYFLWRWLYSKFWNYTV